MGPKLVFFDLETRSKVDIKTHGVHRYARDPSTQIVCASFSFTESGRFGVWAPRHFRTGLRNGIDEELVDLWNSHVRSGGLVVAWNAQFDRLILQYSDGPLRAPSIEQTLCAQAQAENYSLPGKLEKAADTLKVPVQKDRRGKNLIRKLCDANKPWDPDPNDVAAFWAYAMKDTLAMQQVWQRCRKWVAPEWHDYHVLERINERGLPVDIEFADVAQKCAVREKQALSDEMKELTEGEVPSLAHSKAKVEWLGKMLEGTDLDELLWTTVTRKRTKVRARSANKHVQTLLKERLDAGDYEDIDVRKIDEFLRLLDEGNGVASVKFAKMVDLHWEGRLYHQYRCSPTVTGRHAARGVQLDNVIREKLPGASGVLDHPALYAIDHLVAGGDIEELEETFGMPINKILARLIRPTVTAPDGSWLVWGDWSAIEARMLPWFAGAESYLHQFRTGVDVYCVAAIDIFRLKCSWEELAARVAEGDAEAKHQRLIGKVAVLALGYGGGAGALLAMSRGYGLKLDRDFAERVKTAFRAANPWLKRFWGRLDDAIWEAVGSPGARFKVGQVTYQQIGRDLFCFLPDGRPIVYPDVRVEERFKPIFDDTVEVVTYRKAWGSGVVRGELWGGLAAENVTQGGAASLLREKLRVLDARGYRVLAPKHDEVLLESTQPETDAQALRSIMEEAPSWADGLPLLAEVEHGAFYGK